MTTINASPSPETLRRAAEDIVAQFYRDGCPLDRIKAAAAAATILDAFTPYPQPALTAV